MSTLALRATLALGVLAAICAGCVAPVEQEHEGEEAAAASGQTVAPILQCEDLELTELKIVFCGPQVGPWDTSPITVECERECVTERHYGFVPGPPPRFQCVSGETTCGSWKCPSCD